MSEQTASFTMDRVAKELAVMNKDWIAFDERMSDFAKTIIEMVEKGKVIDLKKMAAQIEAFAKESEVRRGRFATLGSIGSPEAWRLFALANHLTLPDPEQDPALEVATALIRKNLNIPQLIYEIATLIEETQGGQNNENST